jgi:hypothetical protein
MNAIFAAAMFPAVHARTTQTIEKLAVLKQ